VAKVNTGLRVEPDIIPDLEELARLMTERAGGVEVTVPAAARAALRRGVDVLRAEMRATEEKPTRARKPAK
jgi:hypothetical protein